MSRAAGEAPLLADVADLDRSGLKTAWEETFGSPPPRHLSTAFMRKALAYERQCQAYGGLPAATRRVLAAFAEGRERDRAQGKTVRPGSHLVRDWNGRTYRVEVVEGGYRFDGRTYRSLTGIARRITGTNWSGPRFFGLAARAKPRAGAAEG